MRRAVPVFSCKRTSQALFGVMNHRSFASGLKRFLKKNAEGETLAVMDSKLGSIIKEKLGISCTYRFATRNVCCRVLFWSQLLSPVI